MPEVEAIEVTGRRVVAQSQAPDAQDGAADRRERSGLREGFRHGRTVKPVSLHEAADAGHRGVHCLRRRIVAVPGHRDSLDAILGEVPVPANSELLAVDVDGKDYHIWESLQGYLP